MKKLTGGDMFYRQTPLLVLLSVILLAVGFFYFYIIYVFFLSVAKNDIGIINSVFETRPYLIVYVFLFLPFFIQFLVYFFGFCSTIVKVIYIMLVSIIWGESQKPNV